MANMTTSGSVSEFERVFGHLTTPEPQPERRLDVIVREGLERIDQAVERVCEKYKAPRIGGQADSVTRDFLARLIADFSMQEGLFTNPIALHSRRFIAACQVIESRGEMATLGRVRELMWGPLVSGSAQVEAQS